MTALWFLWEILINCLECFFFFYLLLRQLGYEKGRKTIVLIGLILIITCESILNFSDVYFVYTMITMLSLRVVYSICLFNGAFPQRLLWGISGTIVTAIANLLISNILPLFSGFATVDTLSPSFARFGVQIFYILIVITLFWLLSRKPKRNKLILPIGLQIVSVIIMALGVFTVGEIVGFSIRMERTIEDRQLLVTVSLAMLIMLVVIVLLFDKMGNVIREKSDAEHQLQIALLEEENIKKSKEMISIWNHDTKNFLEVLNYHANKGDLASIKKYLGETNKNYESIYSLQSTGYSSIDASISSKLIVAHSKNIPVTLNISKISNIPMTESEMCIILGNLFNNAIEACLKVLVSENRYIDFSIYQVRDIVHVDILNSSCGNYQVKNRKFLTNKVEPNHGLGLQSTERYLKKYNCFYKIEPASDYFEVKLFIPTKSDEGRHELEN